MPRGKRLLTLAMWGSGGIAALALLSCIITSNFFFPSADQTDYLDSLTQGPNTSTYFHPNEPTAIRAWKISLAIFGASVAVLMILAFVCGLLYPPPQERPPSPG